MFAGTESMTTDVHSVAFSSGPSASSLGPFDAAVPVASRFLSSSFTIVDPNSVYSCFVECTLVSSAVSFSTSSLWCQLQVQLDVGKTTHAHLRLTLNRAGRLSWSTRTIGKRDDACRGYRYRHCRRRDAVRVRDEFLMVEKILCVCLAAGSVNEITHTHKQTNRQTYRQTDKHTLIRQQPP